MRCLSKESPLPSLVRPVAAAGFERLLVVHHVQLPDRVGSVVRAAPELPEGIRRMPPNAHNAANQASVYRTGATVAVASESAEKIFFSGCPRQCVPFLPGASGGKGGDSEE